MSNPANDYQANHRLPGSQYRGQAIISDQIDEQGLAVVCHALEQLLKAKVPGAIVELGCYVGTTSLYFRRLLNNDVNSSSRELHVYDSFQGLPNKTAPDNSGAGEQFRAGELQVSKKELVSQFHRAGLRLPTIHKAWFADLTASDMPDHIAFAFLDGDFYESIRDSLLLVWPRLDPAGVVVIDDYKRDALPGVERAVSEFFRDKLITIQHKHNCAIISPKDR